MARIVDPRCPRCGAPLPVQPGMDTVTCQYCGARSLIDRGRKPTTAQVPQGMHVVRVAPPSGNAAVVTVMAAVAGMVTASAIAGFLAFGPSGASGAGARPLLGAGPGTYFDDRPMIADVNGDGAPDVIGKSSIPGREAWIGAYDGRDGKPIWKTAALAKDATTPEARRAVVLDRVVSVDALGKAQAYDLRTGKPSWSVPLGEKAKRVCQGDGVVVVETVDDAKHGLDPASGARRALAKDAACKPVPSSNEGEAPGYQLVNSSRFDALGLPRVYGGVEGMTAHHALVPNGPGPRFLLGSRSKGSQVGMAAAVEKTKVLWKTVVPGVDPLTTSTSGVDEAAYEGGHLVVPYDMKDHGEGTRLACFDGATGKRLWDVQIHKRSQVSHGISTSANDVFYATWTALYVFSLRTGELRYMIGTEF
ncbi:outer membrane protein assembly factor BamB family protein [Sorangium sp. So ce1335]|uniref:outer membrane protein assembly factor BamB family protein n=1 Tax=Sorangium sp. So ce1335 TaxID=3133335 RepID=UPI003F63700F